MSMSSSWTLLGSGSEELLGGVGSLPGDVLSDLLRARAAERPANGAAPSTTVMEKIQSARQVERRHEIISLQGRALSVNRDNLERFASAVDKASPTMVVSFLGDTEAGKSTTIRSLMSSDEERPFVQSGAMQTSSTTYNVNLYPCSTLMPGLTVNFMDFEGENGSETPAMAADYGRLAGPGAIGGSIGAGMQAAALAAGGAVGGSPNASYSSSSSGGGSSSPSLLSTAGVVAPSTSRVAGLRGLTSQVLGKTLEAVQSTAASAASAAASASSVLARAEAVREYFPKLAYCCSDMVVLIGTEPFFSTRYMERALAFAKRANAGIQDVELPILLLISNKRNCDECETDIIKSTQMFAAHMGADLQLLDSYFSCIVCCSLPNRKTSAITDEGGIISGEDMFKAQLAKLKTLLFSLLNARLADRDSRSASLSSGPGRRLLTSRNGLWYAMVPKIVSVLSAGHPVHVTRLIDEAWSQQVSSVLGSQDAAMDVFKAMITGIRPPPGLSQRAPRLSEDFLNRFETFYSLACDLGVRLTAARLRRVDASLVFDDRLEAAARPQLEAVLRFLEEIAPCRAVYGRGHRGGGHELGCPVERPDEPVLCLQEQRVHVKTHRGSRRVQGGGSSLWQRLLSLAPYNPVWNGPFEGGSLLRPPVRSLLDEVVGLVSAAAATFLGQHLLELQSYHSSLTQVVQFTALEPAASSHALTLWRTHGGPLRLAPGDPPAPASFPYCVGCGIKVVTGSAAAAAGAGSAAGSAGWVPDDGGEASVTYGAWVKGAVTEILATAGLVSRSGPVTGSSSSSGGEEEAARSVAFATEEATTAPGPAAGAGNGSGRRGGLSRRGGASPASAGAPSPDGVSLPQHRVVLGLCRHCIAEVAPLNPGLGLPRPSHEAGGADDEDPSSAAACAAAGSASDMAASTGGFTLVTAAALEGAAAGAAGVATRLADRLAAVAPVADPEPSTDAATPPR